MRRRPDVARGDEGTTLVETLVTVMIIGTAMIALLGAIAVLVRSQAMQRDQVDVNDALVSAVETIKGAPLAACDGTEAATYQATARDATVLPSTWSPDVITVTSVTCTSTRRLQDVEVRVTNPAGKLAETARVTKYQPENAPAHTEPPPPGPVDQCIVNLGNVQASSWLADIFVSVTVRMAPNQPACNFPLKARVVGNATTYNLRRLRFSFWGFTVDTSYNYFVRAQGQCDDGACQIQILGNDGSILATKAIST
jgi:Tfp pilus assembly protein PilV